MCESAMHHVTLSVRQDSVTRVDLPIGTHLSDKASASGTGISVAPCAPEEPVRRFSSSCDAISAASDSCARCHREGANDRREAGGLSVTRKFDDLKLTIGGAYSKEDSYRSSTLLTTVSRDLANGNTTVAGGFTFSLNQPTMHPTQQVKNQYSSDAYASLTQVLNKPPSPNSDTSSRRSAAFGAIPSCVRT
jgi:hypothetical protein